ncbi:hypothetical protein RN001_008555 [Aquatica leii]|uniref:Uncharacterized protein n=1 Tax=Aquatica leii TaxID=1421715 RepID=A0AAN7SHB1_9COLE|nr:hypothetical protein RN001_008555 [Aquatica leii]
MVRTHEAIDTKYLQVSTTYPTTKDKRALDFIGDFFSWCCGVATERKLDNLVIGYNQMKKFLKQLHSGIEHSLIQISNNSKVFNKYHNKVEENLKEIKNKVNNVNQYEAEFKNKIGRTFSLTEEKVQRTIFYVYDTMIHTLNLERVVSQIEILSTCKDHKIPAIIVNPQSLQTDLEKLATELSKKGYSIAIPIHELSRYYKLSIADCTTAGNKLFVHIKIPIIVTNQEWKLYELITPFAWKNETCILMHETLFMAVSHNQTLKSISGTSLHHCKPYHDKLCYLPRFDSDAIYSPQCAYKMYTGTTVEDLSQHCSFRCHSSQSMLISEISSDIFVITHPKNTTSILCPSENFEIEESLSRYGGEVVVRVNHIKKTSLRTK